MLIVTHHFTPHWRTEAFHITRSDVQVLQFVEHDGWHAHWGLCVKTTPNLHSFQPVRYISFDKGYSTPSQGEMEAVLCYLDSRTQEPDLENGRLLEKLHNQQAEESHHGNAAVDGLSRSSERAELLLFSGRVVAKELGGKGSHGDDDNDSTEVKGAVAMGLLYDLAVNVLASNLAPYALAGKDLRASSSDNAKHGCPGIDQLCTT